MTVRTLIGDCRTILPTLPPGSVQCVVTSPPYYGLRDYGTAQWEGGDAECDHEAPNGQGATGQRADRTFTANQPYREACGKCGARRVDAQIGLEPTPEAYLATMVGVFREVRRVLRIIDGPPISGGIIPQVKPCVVLDPFGGAGTTGLVADRLQRDAVMIELNPQYVGMADARIVDDCPLFSSWPPADDPADERMAFDAEQRDLFAVAAD